MKSEYREAFTEVYEIFKLMPQELLNKIPSKFYEMIEEERDKNYIANIKEPLEEKKLKDETIIILGLIYRDFLCSSNEKERLQKKDKKELLEVQKALEEELKRKYDPEAVLKNRNKIKEQTAKQRENRLVIEKREKWYKKIVNTIKKLLKKYKL